MFKIGQQIEHTASGTKFTVAALWKIQEDSIGIDLKNPDNGRIKYMPIVKFVSYLREGKLKLV